MKKFEDLVFEEHSIPGGRQARLDFENGYGVSVITGVYDNYGDRPFNPILDFTNMLVSHNSNHIFYTDDKNPYEVAVIRKGKLCYDTHITNDVIGHCDKNRVTQIMKQVQKLKN